MHTADDELRQIDLIKIYSTKKCLVIDDFPEIRGSLTRSLRGFGAQSVDTAADGDEAVKLCAQNKYDIVICDYNLGSGKDGQQVLEEVRFLRVLLMTSLFMMLTGESSREMVLGALECQPDDYITKPYTEGSLRTRLNRAMVRHHALLHIKKAISDGDYSRALEGCNELIKSGSRYARDCIKIKGQLLFLLRKLHEARALYESVLDKKPLVWAKLGMSKTLIALGKLDAAEQLLNEIIKEDTRYIEAHDLLAESFRARNDMLRAQQAIETATQVSPKSAHRHRQLAELADLNGDDSLAAKSHLNAIKWGMNSCHESPQDYFNYARKVADTIRKGVPPNDAKAMAKQVHTYMERAGKRFTASPELEAQAVMVQAQISESLGNVDEAKALADRAKTLYNAIPAPSADATLNFARTLNTMDEEDQARMLLATLVAKHPDDKNLLQVIDAITSEPISDAGKEVAARLTKTGIGSYDHKDYAAAIDVFNEALNAYPRHTGLNLNLIQAVLAATENGVHTPEYEQMCRRSLRSVGAVKQDSKHYKRYSYLQDRISKLYPSLVQEIRTG